MNAFSACALAVTAAVIISVLKGISPLMANIASAVAGVVILVYIINGITPFLDFVRKTSAESGIGAYFGIMLKAVAISMCCKAGAEICRDCGENSLASKLELAGKAGILLLSLPLLGGILSMAKDML